MMRSRSSPPTRSTGITSKSSYGAQSPQLLPRTPWQHTKEISRAATVYAHENESGDEESAWRPRSKDAYRVTCHALDGRRAFGRAICAACPSPFSIRTQDSAQAAAANDGQGAI